MPNDPKSDRLLITWDEIDPPPQPPSPQPEEFSSYRPLNFILVDPNKWTACNCNCSLKVVNM